MRETESEGIRGGGTKLREGQAGRAQQERKNAPGLESRDERPGVGRESEEVGKGRVARGDLRQGAWSTQGPAMLPSTDGEGVATEMH